MKGEPWNHEKGQKLRFLTLVLELRGTAAIDEGDVRVR